MGLLSSIKKKTRKVGRGFSKAVKKGRKITRIGPKVSRLGKVVRSVVKRSGKKLPIRGMITPGSRKKAKRPVYKHTKRTLTNRSSRGWAVESRIKRAFAKAKGRSYTPSMLSSTGSSSFALAEQTATSTATVGGTSGSLTKGSKFTKGQTIALGVAGVVGTATILGGLVRIASGSRREEKAS